jgi:hypothetical protein
LVVFVAVEVVAAVAARAWVRARVLTPGGLLICLSPAELAADDVGADCLRFFPPLVCVDVAVVLSLFIAGGVVVGMGFFLTAPGIGAGDATTASSDFLDTFLPPLMLVFFSPSTFDAI